MKSCVTVSLVPEAKGGPFIYWDDLEGACRAASKSGFDAIEIFPPGAASLPLPELKRLLSEHNLELAAIGTGAGWVKRRLTLTAESSETRAQARAFVREIIDVAGNFSAAVIIGSMQGRFEGSVGRTQALAWLGEALSELGDYAKASGARLLYEPLNRYETNLLNRLEDALSFLEANTGSGVKILADLFHMNIEEVSLPRAIHNAGDWIGHVHLADSNRRPAGLGHTDFEPIFRALREIGYEGYISAEALPYPDPDAAAAQTMTAYMHHTRGNR